MQSSDARILRGAAIPSGLAGLAVIAAAVPLAGTKGALGAALGTVVVLAFFTISVVAVAYAAQISPQMMFAAAIFSYLGKVVAMLALVAALDDVTIWNTTAFAWSVIVLTLVWVVAEARATMKIKTITLDPVEAPGVARDRSP